MTKKKEFILGIIIFFALLTRVVNFSLPFLTADEARIAYRGYTLANYGTDELDRPFPLIFNSLSDYQLPVTSYLTAASIFIFGKSDFGARIPFIILGSLLPLLGYQISKVMSEKPNVWILSAVVVGFSPPLIFLSKVPNSEIILTFLFALLFYLLTRKNLNFKFFIIVSCLVLLTSKYAWFILPIFTAFTIYFYSPNENRKYKVSVAITSLIMTLFAWGFFLSLPEGLRSIKENYFSLFSDMTITNGINRLRGQGIEMGWSTFLPKILFNKLIYLPVGFLHWLSNISPAVYFGQLDPSGLISFSSMGAWTKSLILPAILGLVFLIKEASQKQKLFLLYIFILSYPASFKYPSFSPDLVILTLPFLAIIISLGIDQLKGKIRGLVIFLMFLEIGISLLFISQETKAANNIRPGWIKPVVAEVSKLSKTERVIISDNLTEDSVLFILWYRDSKLENSKLEKNPLENFIPYRFRQSSLENIILYGWDQKFQLCGREKIGILFLSNRDLNLVKHKINPSKIAIIKNGLSKDTIFTFSNHLCQD